MKNNTLIGKTLELYTDKNDKNSFCKKEALEFKSMYGINNPIKVELKIIEVFNNNKDFNDSKSINTSNAFGFWECNTNEISTSYIWGSPIQTQVCFMDFGKKALSNGSLFLKFDINIIGEKDA